MSVNRNSLHHTDDSDHAPERQQTSGTDQHYHYKGVAVHLNGRHHLLSYYQLRVTVQTMTEQDGGFMRVTLPGWDFMHASLQDWDFMHVMLQDWDFMHAIQDWDFMHVSLQGWDFMRVTLQDWDFMRVTLQDLDFMHISLQRWYLCA